MAAHPLVIALIFFLMIFSGAPPRPPAARCSCRPPPCRRNSLGYPHALLHFCLPALPWCSSSTPAGVAGFFMSLPAEKQRLNYGGQQGQV